LRAIKAAALAQGGIVKKTLAEQWREQGREQGRGQGLEQGRAEGQAQALMAQRATLLLILRHRFPGGEAELARLARRIGRRRN
jgi:flagellar biosynthesis/type III secretory pathway protein FliH